MGYVSGRAANHVSFFAADSSTMPAPGLPARVQLSCLFIEKKNRTAKAKFFVGIHAGMRQIAIDLYP